jgi:hypothetical protein
MGDIDMTQTNRNMFIQLRNDTEIRSKTDYFGKSALHFELMMFAYTFAVIFLLPSLLFEVRFPSFVYQTVLILSILFGVLVFIYITYLLILQIMLNKKIIFVYGVLFGLFSLIFFIFMSILGIDTHFDLNWIQI